MLNSNERMGFIIEYMSSYDEKIKMANKNGLFDAAKMFELFAIEVCNVSTTVRALTCFRQTLSCRALR